MVCKRVFSLVMAYMAVSYLFAQIAPPANFVSLMQSAGVELVLPLDAGYKAFNLDQNEFQPCQFAIHSRQEKLEIRYWIELPDSNSMAFQAPQVYTSRLLIHLASNDDDAVIAAHAISPETLSHLGADWGKTFFFRPKTAFSSRRHCQLTVLQRQPQGTVYVFLLFDDPNNPAISNRELGLFFIDK